MKPKSEVIASVDPTKTYLGSFVIARINEVFKQRNKRIKRVYN